MAYSTDLRQRVIAHLAKGNTHEETAKTFDVSVTAIKAWKKLLAETGSLKKRPLDRKPRKYCAEKLSKIMAETPDAYLIEIAEKFANGSVSGVRKALERMKITRKKRRFAIKSETKSRGRHMLSK